MFRNTAVRREMTARNKMGVNGVTVYDPCDEEAMASYDDHLFGFEDEDPKARVLAEIATRMLETTEVEECDLGMMVNVPQSDAMDYAKMIKDITTAKDIRELHKIAETYKNMPGAVELAKVCAQEMGYELRLSA